MLSGRMGVGCLFFFLLIVLAVASFMRSTVIIGTGLGSDLAALTPAAIVVGWLFSMGWTVPLAMYAGYAISRERATHTWDMLRTAPYSTEEILLTKAAASIRGVWGTALGIVLTVTVLRTVLIGALLVMAVTAGQLSAIFVIILIPIAIVIILIEAVQEIALSVVLGLVVGLSNVSPRLTIFVGAVSGFMVRLVQLAIIFWFLAHLVSTVSPAVSASSTIAGSTILLPGMPGIVSLLLVLLLALGREGLVRILLASTLQRAHEG
jgi:hypothetical protein